MEEGGKKARGAPSEVRIFVAWRKGVHVSGVRGSGVEGGLRPVPRGRLAKKKKNNHNHHNHAFYSISAEKVAFHGKYSIVSGKSRVPW